MVGFRLWRSITASARESGSPASIMAPSERPKIIFSCAETWPNNPATRAAKRDGTRAGSADRSVRPSRRKSSLRLNRSGDSRVPSAMWPEGSVAR